MSDKTETFCVRCAQSITGKMYGKICSECKIKELEEDVKFYHDKYASVDKELRKWVLKYNDESILKTKYRHAFDALFEKVTGK